MKTKTLHIPFLLLSLTAFFTITSCNDEDKLPKPQVTSPVVDGNKNMNISFGSPELSRLEVPHVMGGNSQTLVHSVAGYGVNMIIEWDRSLRSQRWTCYQMHAANIATNWARNNWDQEPFQPDPMLEEGVRTELIDYRGTGFDRGHILPSADRLNSQEANEQTFYLSNMQPQYHVFNSGIWEKMENFVRNKGKDANFRDILYICKGGTIDNALQRLPNTNTGLIVPKYFFMAMLCEKGNGYKAMAFWVEHKQEAQDGTLRTYAVSIDQLEALTGIDFFCNLPDDIEDKVEASVAFSEWGL